MKMPPSVGHGLAVDEVAARCRQYDAFQACVVSSVLGAFFQAPPHLPRLSWQLPGPLSLSYLLVVLVR
jgi:hypothetical protein